MNVSTAGSKLATRGLRLARRCLGAGLDLVYPPNCACCDAELDSGSARPLFCEACRVELIAATPACPRCGAMMAVVASAGQCPRCDQLRPHFDAAVRLGRYEGALRAAVLRIKRADEAALATALGELLIHSARVQLTEFKVDVVVPVPMHWTRRAWRGANSPETIAQRLAAQLRLPMRTNLLSRRRRTSPQASLSPRQRKANVRGAFRAAKHRDLPGARVLLVDDIMTTGATLNEAAKMLSKAGAGFVAVAVIARAEGLG